MGKNKKEVISMSGDKKEDVTLFARVREWQQMQHKEKQSWERWFTDDIISVTTSSYT